MVNNSEYLNRLDIAIENVLTRDVYKSMKNSNISRHRMHEIAILKVFTYDGIDQDFDVEDVHVLRMANISIERNGYYFPNL